MQKHIPLLLASLKDSIISEISFFMFRRHCPMDLEVCNKLSVHQICANIICGFLVTKFQFKADKNKSPIRKSHLWYKLVWLYKWVYIWQNTESVPSNSSGHNVVKLLLWNQTIMILISLLNHLLQLVLINVLSQIFYHSLQVFNCDESCLLVIEHVEYFLQILLGVLARNSCCHEIQELVKVQLISILTEQIGDHVVNGLVCCLWSKRVKRLLQISINLNVPLGLMKPFRCESNRSKTSLISLISSLETPGLSYSWYLKEELARRELPWTIDPVAFFINKS